MFLLRNLPKQNRQKTRKTNITKLVTNPSQLGFNLRNCNLSALTHFSNFSFFVVAASGGFLHPKCTAYLYSYAKKILRLTKHTARLWVNIPATHIMTRKALNVRMGKGKGGRHGINCAVTANTVLAAVAGSRAGLWHRIQRFMQARCSFVVSSFCHPKHVQRGIIHFATIFRKHNTPQGLLPQTRTAIRLNHKVMVRRKIWENLAETYALLYKVRKIKLMRYLSRAFSCYKTAVQLSYTSAFYDLFMSILNLRLSLYFLRSLSEYTIILMFEQLPDFDFEIIHLIRPRRATRSFDWVDFKN